MADLLTDMLAAPVTPVDGSMGTWGGLLLYIGIALGFSFLCSILEAVLLSTSISHIEILAQGGNKAGELMRQHKKDIDIPISAILTLNTIAHTVGAAGAGAQAAGIFGSEWLGLISAVLTLLILILSEIIPKTLGAVYWKQLTPFAAYTIRVLVVILYPIVWGLQVITRLLSPEIKGPRITRSELAAMIQISGEEGALQQKEGLILRNLLKLNAVLVRDVMTPRTVLLTFQQDMTVGQVNALNRVLPYSRLPIYAGSPDDIESYVLRHDILQALAEDEDDRPLHQMARPIHSVPETASLGKVLDEFIARQEHMFLVFDEYGGIEGIITMEDAIESLLGAEITDESDLVTDMRELAKARALRKQRMLEAVQQDREAKKSAAADES